MTTADELLAIPATQTALAEMVSGTVKTIRSEVASTLDPARAVATALEASFRLGVVAAGELQASQIAAAEAVGRTKLLAEIDAAAEQHARWSKQATERAERERQSAIASDRDAAVEAVRSKALAEIAKQAREAKAKR